MTSINGLSIITNAHPDGHSENGTMSSIGNNSFATISVNLKPAQFSNVSDVKGKLKQLFKGFDFSVADVMIEIGSDSDH